MIIDDIKDLYKVTEFINQNEELAFDIETTGLSPLSDKVIGFGVSNDVEGFYIVHFSWNGTELREVIPFDECVKVLNLLKTKKWTGWNSSFECRFCQSYFNVDLVSSLWSDGMLAKHTVDEERPFALKELAQKLYGDDATEEQLAMKQSIKDNGGNPSSDYYMADSHILGTYCIQDCFLTYKINNKYLDEINKQGLSRFYFQDEVMPMYKEVIIPMESKGVKVDIDLLSRNSEEIVKDIKEQEGKILDKIEPYLDSFRKWWLNKEMPPRRSGTFAQYLCMYYKYDLPKTKTGKLSITAKTLEDYEDHIGVKFLNDGPYLPEEDVYAIQLLWYAESGQPPMFNLSSKDHLKRLFFDELGEEPVSRTDKGNPQVDHLFLLKMKDKYDWVEDLLVFNRLNKLQGTYIDRYLEHSVDGVFYPGWFMHRTTSGRLGGDLMQLPRKVSEEANHPLVVKYNNIIRDCIVSGSNRKLVGADYSSLEVVVFADDSGDESLLNMIRNGEDFYSKTAIGVHGLEDKYSADKNADNFLKNHEPELRQDAKCFDKDTKVRTEAGIKDIVDVKIGDYVLTSKGYKKVLNITKRENSNVGLFITNRGILKCTSDHKVWNVSKNSWVEASNFEGSDLIQQEDFESKVHECLDFQKLPIWSNASFKNSAELPIGYLDFNEDWGYILGAYLGDGVGSYTRRKIVKNQNSTHNSHLISSYVGICGLKEDLVVDQWASLVSKYGYNVAKYIRSSQASGGKDLSTYIVRDFEFVKLFQSSFKSFLDNGDNLTGRKNLKIPDFVFNSPEQVRVSFIAGLLDTDGYLILNHGKLDISFCTKDYRLGSDLLYLLHSLGVAASLSVSYNKTYDKDYYIIRILRKGSYRLANLGINKYMACPRKKEAFSFSENTPRLNTPVRDDIFIKFVPIEELQTTYDITVDDVSEFFAGGIRVHNCYSLGVRYGMQSFKLSKTLGIEQHEADDIIDSYFKSYPNLKLRMDNLVEFAKKHGFVRSKGGRIRHLPMLKKLQFAHGEVLGDSLALWKKYHDCPKKYKQMQYLGKQYRAAINNALNFPIQSMAASITNRACVAITREFRRVGLDAHIIMQIHDEIVVSAAEKDVPRVKKIMKFLMENTTKLSIPLNADPEVGDKYGDIK